MSEISPFQNEIDAYITTLTDEERHDISLADTALTIISLLYQAHQSRDRSQITANILPGLRRQIIGWLEHSASRDGISALQRYLTALGYSVDIALRDIQTGTIVGQIPLTSHRET